jgi:hypothetical protein
LKLIQNIDKNPQQNQFQKIKSDKDYNLIKCLICNTICKKNDSQSNQLKLKIKNYLNEKKKVDIFNCEDEVCSNVASIRCDECKLNLCEECSNKLHKFGFKTFRNHKIEKIMENIQRQLNATMKLLIFIQLV